MVLAVPLSHAARYLARRAFCVLTERLAVDPMSTRTGTRCTESGRKWRARFDVGDDPSPEAFFHTTRAYQI